MPKTTSTAKKPPHKTTEFDSPWKDIIERYFPAFIELFYPALHSQIDWRKGVKFLDKELTKVVREAVTQQRRVDSSSAEWRPNLCRPSTLEGVRNSDQPPATVEMETGVIPRVMSSPV